MAYFYTSHSNILAISSCIPKKKEKTTDYAHISAEERELFIKTTGIKERRVADANTTCSDLCFEAAKDILKRFNCTDDIDLLLFVSQSPDYFLPSTAVILQHKLNLKKSCLAFDVTLGCSGYVYGLSIVSHLLQSGQLKKALLLVGDKSTISTSYTDKSTYPLFGDAGTATLIEYNKNAANWHFNLQSDGSGKNAIIIETGHSRNPYHPTHDELTEIEPGITRAKKHLALNGMDIFNFALKEVGPNIQQLFQNSNIPQESIDHFIFHQANKLINESVRKKMKIDENKVPYSIHLFGNTSSASIPLTMCHAIHNELMQKKNKLLLSGFGVGFSWGSVILETDQLSTTIFEYEPA